MVSFLAWLSARIFDSMFDSAVDKEIVLILRDGRGWGCVIQLATGAALLALLFLHRALLAPRLRPREDKYYWPEVSEPQDVYPSDPG